MKRLCNDITDGILVYGDGDGDSKESLLILDFATGFDDTFKVFYETVDGTSIDVVNNLSFKEAIALFHSRLENM